MKFQYEGDNYKVFPNSMQPSIEEGVSMVKVVKQDYEAPQPEIFEGDVLNGLVGQPEVVVTFTPDNCPVVVGMTGQKSVIGFATQVKSIHRNGAVLWRGLGV